MIWCGNIYLSMSVCVAFNPWKLDYISFSSCIMTAEPGNRNNRYCSSVRASVCAWLEADNSRVVQIGTVKEMTSADHTNCHKKQVFPSDTKWEKIHINGAQEEKENIPNKSSPLLSDSIRFGSQSVSAWGGAQQVATYKRQGQCSVVKNEAQREALMAKLCSAFQERDIRSFSLHISKKWT